MKCSKIVVILISTILSLVLIIASTMSEKNSLVHAEESNSSYSLVSKPIDYKVSTDISYETGETITFGVDLFKEQSMEYKLYIDFSHDQTFDGNELIDHFIMIEGYNTIEVNVPDSINSGVYQWKLLIYDEQEEHVETGFIKILGEKNTIHVLNVVSDLVAHKDSLLNPELTNEYFNKTNEYEIIYTTCTLKEFKKNNSQFECSWINTLETHDVIILGPDIFDDHPNVNAFGGKNKNLGEGLKQHIQNGKPVIFTSSITKGRKHWLDNFADDIGFTQEFTDVHQNTNKLEVINVNEFTLYPFNVTNETLTIPEDIQIPGRESLKFDPTLITPLLVASNDTGTNVANNTYFSFSDNVIYLNIGSNTNNMYTVHEHQLLVNAIVNSYVKGNGKTPTIDLDENRFEIRAINNYENAVISSGQELTFDFRVLSLNSETNYQYDILNNNSVVQSFETKRLDQNAIRLTSLIPVRDQKMEEMAIELVVKNNDNDTLRYEFYTFVLDYADAISLNREIDTTEYNGIDYIELYNPTPTTYTVEANNIDISDVTHKSLLPDYIELTDITFKEQLPIGIRPTNLPNGLLSYGTIDEGITIIGNLNKLTFKQFNNEYVSTDSLEFSYDMTGYEIRDYAFLANESSITFMDPIKTSRNKSFNSIDISVAKSLATEGTVEINAGEYVFIPYNESYDLSDLMTIDENLLMTLSNTTLLKTTGNDDPFTQTNQTITSVNIGEQYLDIYLEDAFGYEYSRRVALYTYEPIETLDVSSLDLVKGDSGMILIDSLPELTTESIQIEDIEYYNRYGSRIYEPVVSLTKQQEGYDVKGIKAGRAVINFYGYDKHGDRIYATSVVHVKPPTVATIDFDQLVLYKGDNFTYNVRMHAGYEHLTAKFRSLNSDIVSTTESGTLTGDLPGTAVVLAEFYDGDLLIDTYELIVMVQDILSEDSGFIKQYSNDPYADDINYDISTNQYVNLADLITISPRGIMEYDDVEIVFNILDGEEYATFDDTTYRLTSTTENSITVEVIITQYDNDDNVVNSVRDVATFNYLKPLNPTENSGEDRY